jgi:hypothetical protein
MDIIAGGCQIQEGCDKSCFRFRADPENEVLCGHCKHDISNHKIIALFHDGKFFPVGENATVAAAPQALQLHESAEEERRRLFKTKETRERSRQSVGNKRKITTDADVPRRLSGGRTSSPAVASKNIAPKIIAMVRKAEVPQTVFDHTELGQDHFQNVELSTAKNFTSILKLRSTLGEEFSKKWYFYIRLTNKTLKPTQYWSKNWPSDRAIASLCLEKFLYDIPFCYRR